jgi:predicted thioredoxin/glutaredoxin
MENRSFQIENFSKKIGEELVELYPNLKLEDSPMLMYILLRSMIGKGFYAHLEFTLENDKYVKDLEALSNGYVELDGKVLRMGVTEFENLEKILQTHYIKPKSVHILER